MTYPTYLKVNSPSQGPVVFMLPAKCASNSIKTFLRRVTDTELTYMQKVEFLNGGFVTVGVVRHPLSRLVSCWREKIIHRWSDSLQLRLIDMRPQMPFAEFLGVVLATPDVSANRHFRSYTDELVVAGTKPSMVLRTESLNEQWASVEKYFGFPTLGIETCNPTYKNPLVTLTRSQIAAIEFRYQKDLGNFGYSMTEWPADEGISYDIDSD